MTSNLTQRDPHTTDQLGVGTVWFHPDFEFENGERSDKLLVLIAPSDGTSVVFCTTTSNGTHYKRNLIAGCGAPFHNSFKIDKDTDFFNVDTWLQFHQLCEFTFEDMLQRFSTGQFKHHGFLKEKTVRAILNCISKSKEDVSKMYLKRIAAYQKALPAPRKP